MIESEKALEKKLQAGTKKAGGICLKLLSKHFTGLPDRVCLFPGGVIFFVEVKTTKKKPTKIQLYVHGQLKKLGFAVYIVDTSNQIKELIKKYTENA